MNNKLSDVLTLIKTHKVKTFNYSKTKEEAICINILEVPESIYSVVTVTVLNKRRKRASLNFTLFAKLMTELDYRMSQLREYFDYCTDDCCFVSLNGQIDNSWYRALDCHRLYLIPTSKMFRTLEKFSEDNLEEFLKFGCGIKEVSIYMNTSTHNLKISRFH